MDTALLDTDTVSEILKGTDRHTTKLALCLLRGTDSQKGLVIVPHDSSSRLPPGLENVCGQRDSCRRCRSVAPPLWRLGPHWLMTVSDPESPERKVLAAVRRRHSPQKERYVIDNFVS